MATVQITYTWPSGGTLSVAIAAKARNVEALADMRIEAERLWAKANAELAVYDAAPSE